MPSDFNLRSFPYAGISVPSESPFFPVVFDDNGSKKVRFNQGYVFDYGSSLGGTGSPVNKITVEMDDDYPAQDKFHVKIITSGGTTVASATLETGEFSSTTDGEYGVEVCSFGEDGNIENTYLRENIHWRNPSSSIIHDWKTVKTGDTSVSVSGGTITEPFLYVDGVSLTASSNGFVLLKISRDSSSRAIISTEILFNSDVTTSDYPDQYIPLAFIFTSEGKITDVVQLKFEELHIFESLVVVDGEFKFAELLTAGRNMYSPQTV